MTGRSEWHFGTLPVGHLGLTSPKCWSRTTTESSSAALGLIRHTGQGEYDGLRPLSYPNTDVFILIFSVVSPSSFQNVFSKWIPELRRNTPDVPIVLFGARTERRTDEGVVEKLREGQMAPITTEEGTAAAAANGCVGYRELSARTGMGVWEAFDFAFRAGLGLIHPEPTPHRTCAIS